MPSGIAGDTLLMAGQNGILRLNPPFIFYGQAMSEMYIHENGLVSFGLCQECPVVIDFSFATPPLIAPLWFEAATLQGNVLYRIATDNQTLTASRNYILSELGEDFSPSYVVVITWTEVPGPPEASTFQALFGSNGTHSYVLFAYADVQVSGNIQVGFSYGDGLSFRRIASLLMGNIGTLTSQSNVQADPTPGRYIYRVDSKLMLL